MQSEKRSAATPSTETLEEKVSRIDQSLDVMNRHERECQDVELAVQDAMKKWDREYKDEHLHSVPRARKHSR